MKLALSLQKKDSSSLSYPIFNVLATKYYALVGCLKRINQWVQTHLCFIVALTYAQCIELKLNYYFPHVALETHGLIQGQGVCPLWGAKCDWWLRWDTLITPLVALMRLEPVTQWLKSTHAICYATMALSTYRIKTGFLYI